MDFRILTVCSGNICRSPLAEQLLRARLSDLPGFEISSAGTVATDGDTMPEQAAALSVRHGGSPERHLARYLVPGMLDSADLILAMSRSHRREIVERTPKALAITFTLREFARLSSNVGDEAIRESVSGALRLRAGLGEVVALVAMQKGMSRPADPADDDIVDPYRRSDSTYRLSASQLVPAVEEVSRVLRTGAEAFNLARG